MPLQGKEARDIPSFLKGPTEAEIKKRLPVAGGAGRQALRIDD
jgi:hypothetical protein